MSSVPRTRRWWLSRAAAGLALAGCGPSGDGPRYPRTGAPGDTGSGAGTPAGTATTPPLDVAAIPEDLVMFPAAVKAGSLRDDTVRLHVWAAADAPLVLRVWQGAQVHVDRPAVRDADGYVKEVVSGLEAGAWYEYAFLIADGEDGYAGRSLIGRFRAVFAADALLPLTFATSACNGGVNLPWPQLQTTALQPIDLFLHLGDQVYGDAALDLAAYRALWQVYHSGAGFRDVLAAAGSYATWDDHEVANGYNADTVDPVREADAHTAFYEWTAMTPQDGHQWQSFRWGETAEFFVLDCRSERRPTTRGQPDEQYLSPEQMAWLKAGLRDSPCRFKVVMNSVPITDFPPEWDGTIHDRWEGYPSQRAELLDHLQANDVRGVLFVCGDFHICFLGRVEAAAAGALASVYEVGVTGGNTRPTGDALADMALAQFPFAATNPHATLVSLDPVARTATVSFLDKDTGAVAYGHTLDLS